MGAIPAARPHRTRSTQTLFIVSKARLWVGEGSVAEAGFVVGVAGRLASFHAPEEGFVDSMQDLGVDGIICWSDLFDGGKLGTLLREGDALAALLIGVLPLLQCGVVQLRAVFELLMQQAFLLLGWAETVLIGFLHTSVFFFGRGKGEVPPLPLPQARNATCIPMFESRGLQRRRLVNTMNSFCPFFEYDCTIFKNRSASNDCR